MLGKIGIAILLVFLLLAGFRTSIADGIKGWRTDSKVQSASVTTAVIDNSANVTLTQALFQDDTAEVSSITSNNTFDVAVASTYTTATKVLLIGGLVAGATHSLTIHYLAETTDMVMQVMGPFLGFLVFGGLMFGIYWGVFKKKSRGG